MITTKPIDIEDAHADILQNAFKKHLSNGIHVYAFGSRANWQAKRASDLDLAIDANDALKRNIGNLEEELSLSDLPYKVDIVNLNSISDSFRKAIMPDLVPILWDWREIKISEIVEVIGGGTPKTSVTEYWNGDIPWLSVADFNSGKKYVYNAEKHITTLALNKSSTNILAKGDIIISARGTVGVVAMLATTMTFNQSCYGIRANQKSFNGYIYYLLKDAVHHLQRISHGGVFNTITRDTFKEIKISLPPISEQKAIASVLSSIDDKIDLLHRQNNTLESIAETIFRQWFIEEADDSWFHDELRNYVTVIDNRGKTPLYSEEETCYPLIEVNALGKKNRLVDYALIKKYVNKDIFDHCFRNKLTKYDTLLSTVGSIAAISMYVLDLGNIAQNVIGLSAKGISPFYLYQCLKHKIHEILLLDIGGVQPSIKVPHLLSLAIPIPPSNLQRVFENQLIDFVSKMEINYQQIQTLECLRDMLLPKLISGDIRVEYEEVS